MNVLKIQGGAQVTGRGLSLNEFHVLSYFCATLYTKIKPLIFHHVCFNMYYKCSDLTPFFNIVPLLFDVLCRIITQSYLCPRNKKFAAARQAMHVVFPSVAAPSLTDGLLGLLEVDQTGDSPQREGQSVRWMHQCHRQHDSIKFREEIRD